MRDRMAQNAWKNFSNLRTFKSLKEGDKINERLFFIFLQVSHHPAIINLSFRDDKNNAE